MLRATVYAQHLRRTRSIVYLYLYGFTSWYVELMARHTGRPGTHLSLTLMPQGVVSTWWWIQVDAIEAENALYA